MGTRQVWPGWPQFGIISIWYLRFSEIVQAKPSQLQIPEDIVSVAAVSCTAQCHDLTRRGIWMLSKYDKTWEGEAGDEVRE